MVLEITNKEFFKEINYKPSNDSDGGADYINGVDQAVVGKFNRRWNGNDKMLKDLQDQLQKLIPIIKTGCNQYGYLYEDDFISVLSFGKAFNLKFEGDGFGSGALGLDVLVNGGNAVLKTQNAARDKLIMPSADFIDFVEIGNEQFSIAAGNTNLFEIQEDTDLASPPDTKLLSNRRWYRLGHDGAELTPALVTVRHTLSSSVQWAALHIVFEDYVNNPTGKKQIIRIKGNTHNEYMEVVLDPDQANYRFNAAVWDGGSLVTYTNQDTGVARTAGVHQIIFSCEPINQIIIVDTVPVIFTNTETFEYVDVLEFESENDTGSQDYFDIQRFNVYHADRLTLSAGAVNYIYANTQSGYAIETNTGASSAGERLLLYVIDIPSGATSITADMVSDWRDSAQMHKNPILEKLKTINLNCEKLQLPREVGNTFFITNDSDLTDWLAAQADNDTVYISGSFTHSSVVTISASNVLLKISRNVIFSNNITVTGDNVTIQGGNLSGTNLSINSNADNLTIDGLDVEITHTTSGTAHVFNVYGSGTTSRYYPKNPIIKNCKIKVNKTTADSLGSYIFFMEYCNDSSIFNNLIEVTGTHSIRLFRSYSLGAFGENRDYTRFYNNQYINTSSSATIDDSTVYIASEGRFLFSNNKIIGTTVQGMYLYNDLTVYFNNVENIIANNIMIGFKNLTLDGSAQDVERTIITGNWADNLAVSVTYNASYMIITGNRLKSVGITNGTPTVNMISNNILESISTNSQSSMISNNIVTSTLTATGQNSNISNNRVSSTITVSNDFQVINGNQCNTMTLTVDNSVISSNYGTTLTVTGTGNELAGNLFTTAPPSYPIIIKTSAQLTSWLSSQANGDYVKIVGTFTHSSAVTITATYVRLEIGKAVTFSNKVTLSGDRIFLRGGRFTYASTTALEDNITITGSHCEVTEVHILADRGTTQNDIAGIRVYNDYNLIHDNFFEISGVGGTSAQCAAITIHYINSGKGTVIRDNKMVLSSNNGFSCVRILHTKNQTATGADNWWHYKNNHITTTHTGGTFMEVYYADYCEFVGNMIYNTTVTGSIASVFIWKTPSGTGSYIKWNDNKFHNLHSRIDPPQVLYNFEFKNNLVGSFIPSILDIMEESHCINNTFTGVHEITDLRFNRSIIHGNRQDDNDLYFTGSYNSIVGNYTSPTHKMDLYSGSYNSFTGNIYDNLTITTAGTGFKPTVADIPNNNVLY